MTSRRSVSILAVLGLLGGVAAAHGGAAAAPGTTEPAPAPTEPSATETTGAAAEAPSGEPIVIGALTSLTGPFTLWGLQARDGMQLAVDEINAAGGVGGRPLELSVVDDESDPEAGASGIERLIEEGAVAVGGIIGSNVGLATARVAEELETPLFLIKSGDETILTQDSRYTFRTCLPSAPMVAQPIAQYVQDQGITRVGAIIADYAWGQAIGGAMEDAFAELEGVELQIEVAPVPEQDFTTYLRSLESFEPELLVATGHPPGSGAITVQSFDLGLDIPVTGAYSPLAAVVEGAADAAIGRYFDWDCADYASDEYQELAVRYLAASDNTFMEDDAVAGYGIVQMVAQAVEAVGDDPVAIAEYLRGQTFDLPGYPFELGWTEWGEIAAAQPLFTVIGEGPAPEGVNEAGNGIPRCCSCPSRSSRTCPAEVLTDATTVPILELEGVQKHFGGLPAVDGVTLRVDQGEILALIGPNGAGKSTLLKAIGGLDPPTSGAIRLMGADVTRLPAHRTRQAGIAMVLQTPRPFAEMTVRENVVLGAMFGSTSGRPNETTAFERAEEALGFVRLAERGDDDVSTLNLHEQRFLELARALAGRPQLLLLDEVMAGLNDTELHASIEIVRTARDELGVTVIWVEHVMKAVLSLAERIVVLHFGRLLADGAPHDVMVEPAVVTAYLGERKVGRQR